MPAIDPDRLLDDLRTLRTFGATGTGVVRPALSPIDMEARRWLAGRMEAAGLDARIDGVGNVLGRARRPGPALVVGSHADTQPRGGWLDGAMGVVYGLEVARALAEDPATREYAVDAVAWSDEERTYLGCLGSRSFAGILTDAEVDGARNAAGEPLRAAIARAGLEGVAPARHEPQRQFAYLEAHIEQGPNLEEQGNRIGVVTSIVGSRGFRIRFAGEQNHAGTTPMRRRKDAGVALVRYAVALHDALAGVAGPRSVWTVGRCWFDPGAASIVPGFAEMIVQMRDPEEGPIDAMEATMRELAAAANRAGPVGVEIVEDRSPVAPTRMDEGLMHHLDVAAERHAPGRWLRMPSAAGHDPMVLVACLPCAMLFVPSIGGVSHDFAEDTSEDDIVLGCRVLADAAASVLGERHAARR